MQKIVDLLHYKKEKELRAKLETIEYSLKTINEMYDVMIGVGKLFIPLSEGSEEYVFDNKTHVYFERRYLIGEEDGDHSLALYVLLSKHLIDLNKEDPDDYSSILPIYVSLLEVIKDDDTNYEEFAVMEFKAAIDILKEKIRKYLIKGRELTFSYLPGTKSFIIALGGKGAKIEHNCSTSFDFCALEFEIEANNYPKG